MSKDADALLTTGWPGTRTCTTQTKASLLDSGGVFVILELSTLEFLSSGFCNQAECPHQPAHQSADLCIVISPNQNL